jgi:polyisoprenoid-binding protein YceI
VRTGVFLRYLAVVLTVGLVPTIAAAGEWHVKLDPESTHISFTLKATMHTVTGTSQLASGVLVIDPETGSVSAEIVVDAASTDTGNTGRDKKMHGKVLLSTGHSQIVFRPDHFEETLSAGSNTGVTLVGEFELLGKSHPISIPLDIRIDGSHFEATAEFPVPYVEWGLEDPSTFVLRVAKEVQIRVTAEGTIAFGNGG